uniref:Zic family member 3 n=1 Tax=Hucho hucho TaxID=62062 RepID=A0A4W5QWH1_9TELE
MTKLVDGGAQFSALGVGGVGIPRQHEPGDNDLRLGISPYGETSRFAAFNLIAACQDIAPAQKSQFIPQVSGYAAALGSHYGGHIGSHGYRAIDSRNFTFTYRTPDIVDSAARDTRHGCFSRTATRSVRIPPRISENRAHTIFPSIGEQSASPNGYMANSRAHLGTQGDIYVGADPHQPVSSPHPHFSDTQLHFDHNVDMGMRVATQNGHGAFFRYMRQHSKQDATCKWIDANQTNQLQKTCDKMFCCMSELVTHVSMDHVGGPDPSLHTCFWEDCPREGKSFKAKYKLVNHIRVHTGEKPFNCPFHGCGKMFARSENLKIHKRIHTGEKPFKCEFEGCDRRFANSSDRKKHMHVHTSDKPYICKLCDKAYTHPSSLRKHSKVHKSQTSENSPTGTSGYESSTPPAPCRPTSSTIEDSTKTSMLLVKCHRSIFKEDRSTNLVEWYV